MSYVGIELNKLGMHVLTQYNDYLKLKKKKLLLRTNGPQTFDFFPIANQTRSLKYHKNTLFNINRLQIGGGFARSLSVADINGDGMLDIIVGAPFEYINMTGHSSVKADILVDVGRIYIFLGDNTVSSCLCFMLYLFIST